MAGTPNARVQPRAACQKARGRALSILHFKGFRQPHPGIPDDSVETTACVVNDTRQLQRRVRPPPTEP